MAKKKFTVEVEYVNYEGADDPVNMDVIIDGVNMVMESLVLDGELSDYEGIRISEDEN